MYFIGKKKKPWVLEYKSSILILPICAHLSEARNYPTIEVTLPSPPLVEVSTPSNSTGATMGERTRLLSVPFPLAAVNGIGLAPRLELAGLRILPEDVKRGLPGTTAAVAALNGTGKEL